MSQKQIKVKGKVAPEVVAAIVAALSAARSETGAQVEQSKWAQSARAAQSWRQNGKRRWRDGLRR